MLHFLLLTVHIGCGILGILSGTAAQSFRKGSPRHALAGKIFVASMLTMAAAAVYLAILKHQTPNILAGVLAFYLITTGWLTARRGDAQTSRFDWGVLRIPLAGGSWVGLIGLGKLFSHTPPNDGVPIGIDFFISSVMLVAAAGNISMMVRRSLFGIKRLVRHSWRMCFGLFIATGSFFLGQQQVFPGVLRGSILLTVLPFLPLALLIFWFFRVRFTNAFKGRSLEPASTVTVM